MAVKQIPQGVGLYTDGSGVDAPPGAMRVADNVLMHRQGMIVPRPGFGDTDGLGDFSSVTQLPVRGHAFADDIVLQCVDTSGTYKWVKLTNGASNLGDQAAPDDVGTSDSAQMRGNLYVTTDEGLHKLTGLSATLERAGAFTSYQPLTIELGNLTSLSEDADHAAVQSDSSVAYRWVWRHEDTNGYIRRSAPSSREVVNVPSSYTTGARCKMPNDGLYLHGEWEAGDAIEFYRTRNSGSENADPGDDYYLAGEYVLTSADITAGFILDVFIDRIPDDALGPALYTSVSQQGATASKEQPPQGKVVAAWQRCLWLGDIAERTAQLLQVREVRASTASVGTGVCGDVGGTYSGVSGNDLTGVSLSSDEWDCLAVGMWLSDATPFASTGRIPLNGKITAFDEGATTITLDVTPTSSGSFNAGDLVTINGVEFAAYTSGSPAQRRFDASNDADPGVRCYETSLSLAKAVSYYSGVAITCTAVKDEQLGAGDGTLLLINNDPAADTAITIDSSRPGAFAPYVDGFEKLSDPKPGAIAWSSIDEPEAWPVLQQTPVGDVNRRVLALTPLDNALIVWKEDGVFRVTGSPPSAFVVDEITASSDAPLRLLSPQCVAVLGGSAYAWTDQGFVEVGEGGVQRMMSGTIADVFRGAQRQLTRGLTDPARGYWLRAHPRLGLLILGIGTDTAGVSSGDLVGSAEQYVWARSTGAWQRWARADRCMTYDPAQDRLLACPVSDNWLAYYERTDEGVAESYIDAISGSISASVLTGVGASFSTVTVAKADVPWTPTTCDIVNAQAEGGAAFFRITAVQADGTDWDLTLDGVATTGSVTLYQGFAATMQWQAQQMAGMGQRWQEIHLGLERVTSEHLATVPVAVGGAAHRDAVVSTVSATITPTVTYSQPLRAGVPRACVRSPHLYPYAQICGAGFHWELSSVYLHHTTTSRRVAR